MHADKHFICLLLFIFFKYTWSTVRDLGYLCLSMSQTNLIFLQNWSLLQLRYSFVVFVAFVAIHL